MKIERVLVVDDEEDIRTVAEMSLSVVGGLQVSCVSSGAEAVRVAATLEPDVILLDVMMPGMDGLETLRALRQRPETSAIPIVLMTAKVQRHEVDGYLRAGADAVIPKPFDPMALPAELVRLMADL